MPPPYEEAPDASLPTGNVSGELPSEDPLPNGLETPPSHSDDAAMDSQLDQHQTDYPATFTQENPATSPGAYESLEHLREQSASQETVYEEDYERVLDTRRDTIPISRAILYAIGGLIVTVGIGSFLLGWGMARNLAPVQIRAATSHRIHGNVTYVTRSGQLAPDTQTVVVALPRRKMPDQKFSAETLRPDNVSFRTGQDPIVLGIRSLGGDVGVTDQSGGYELEVSEAGEYFLLILSSHVALPANKRPISTEIVELGRYFRQANDLLGKNDYVWVKQFVRKAKQVDTTFGT